MITFVGAGPGAEDLITVRGQRLLQEADIIVYAGSLVNPGLLSMAGADCEIYNSAKMTLEEVMDVMTAGERAGKKVVRLHTGDPCLYGAIREQMDALEKAGISYEVCPGVSSFCGAAAALDAEYTLPGVSQSVVITRMAGRTPVPERESIQSFAAHQATMVIFLSTGMLKELSAELISGGYEKDTPAAIVYKATWPEEKVLRCTVGTLAETAAAENVTKTALIVVGRILEGEYDRSKLYDPSFTTEFRKGSDVYHGIWKDLCDGPGTRRSRPDDGTGAERTGEMSGDHRLYRIYRPDPGGLSGQRILKYAHAEGSGSVPDGI